jgi:hypothetical protein
VETEPYVKKLLEDLIAIFESDPEIKIAGISDEFPL